MDSIECLSEIKDSLYISRDDLFKIGKENVFLSIIHLNIRSFLKQKAELEVLLEDMNQHGIHVDVICLCETFLTTDNIEQGKLTGYNQINKTRKDKIGGGVSIFVKDGIDILSTIDTTYDENLFESASILIRKQAVTMIVSEFYKAPNVHLKDFLEIFQKYMNDLCKIKSDAIVICADQNIDLMKVKYHHATENFYDILLNHNLEPLISKPTRVTHGSATLIDNIYVKLNRRLEVEGSIMLEDLSDHFPCLAVISSEYYCDKGTELVIEKRKLNKDVYMKINENLLFTDWNEIYVMNVDESYEFLINKILKYLDKHAPMKQIKIGKKSAFIEPWITVRILKYNTKCKRLFKCAIGKAKDSKEYVRYFNYKKVLTQIKRVEKKEFYAKLFTKIGNNTKSLWSVLNGLINKSKNKHSITNICDEKGNVVSDKGKVSEMFNHHFVNAGIRVQSNIKKGVERHTDYLKYKYKSELLFNSTNEIEIYNIVQNMKAKTSCGYDLISNCFLKEIITSIREPLSCIFNKSLQCGVFPRKMKIARVIPLYKNNGNMLCCDNYRPISLLPVISKILEKLVFKRLTCHMELNDHIYAKQFGFRKHHSCVNAVQTFIGNVLEGFDKNMMCLSVFIDLKKAFDTVHHNVVLDKLKHMGILGKELMWFESYLSGRSQYVDINGNLSEELIVSTGVPQGSLMGVLLFQIVINDLRNALKHTTGILYADDTTIFAIGNNPYCLEKKVEADLQSVSMWLSANYLSLNVTKTKYMIMKPDTLQSFPFELRVNGTKIEQTHCLKFLGMLIDDKCTWSKHCEHLISKLKKLNFVINRLKDYIPSGCMRDLYFAHFHSHLSFGITLWGNSILKAQMDEIYKLQKRSVRIITKSNYFAHSDPLFKRTKILKLSDLIMVENVKLIYKVVKSEAPKPLINLYEFNQNNSRNMGIIVKKHKSKKYNDSFLCKPVLEWNKLKQEYKEKSVYFMINRLKDDCFK